MGTRAPTVRPPLDNRERRVTGYHSRSERRLSRRAARRRRKARLWTAVGALVLLVAAAVALVVLLGGGAEAPWPTSSSEVLGSGQGAGPGQGPGPVGSGDSPLESQAGVSQLLLIRQDERICGGLLVQSRATQGVVVGIPGISLLRSGDRFVTLAELADSVVSGTSGVGGGTSLTEGETAATEGWVAGLRNALGEALGLSTMTIASAEWLEVLARLEGEGVLALPQGTVLGALIRTLDPEGADIGQAALALAGWLGGAREAGADDPWQGLSLQGEVERFRSASPLLSRVDSWSYGVVTGKLHGGETARYLDPALAPVRDMLAKASGQPLARVEVQNGSGVVGAAEQAAETLAGLGFELLPVRNAPGFPDVVETMIVAAPDVELQSLVIHKVLGLGNLSTDASLGEGSVVVIVGRDYQVRR